MNTAEVAEDLLDKHSAIHSNRPRLVMVNELMGWNFSFGLMEYGDEWYALTFLGAFFIPLMDCNPWI